MEPAHMELSEPSIATAYENCVKQGAERIICHPFFLSRGRHVQEDIPSLLAAAASNHPGTEYSVTETLGVQDEILDLIESAVKASLDK